MAQRVGAMLDDSGQPDPALNAERRARREIEEMLEICRGILVRGEIAEAEATAFAAWTRHHPELADLWPASVVARRLASIFVEGMLTCEDWEELLALLEMVRGTDSLTATDAELSHYLALDEPPPPIVVPGNRFCFTGRFLFGTRRACKATIIARGGEVLDNVRPDLDYLVIGLLGSRNWIHVTRGLKIHQAIEYRQQGRGVAMVSEKHWAEQLSQT